MPMTPPILTNEGVNNYLRVLERKVGIPDHRNMAIFQLANKFTFTRTFTSRLAVFCMDRFLLTELGFLLISFHAGASRRLTEEGSDENGGKIHRMPGRLYI